MDCLYLAQESRIMKTLLNDISQTSKIDADQAKMALGVVLGFLGARLPSPVMGRIREALNAEGQKTNDVTRQP
jgi:hypothetical protein